MTKRKDIQNFLGAAEYLGKRGVFTDQYDEPTYVGFYVEFDFLTPGLDIVAGDYDYMPHGLLCNENAPYSAEKYLRSKNEIARADALKAMREMLMSLTKYTPHYIQSISGLDSLYKLDPKENFRAKEAKITLKLLEGIDWRVTAFFDLYRRAAFDTVWHRWLLPDIHRFFRMKIYVTEARSFHMPRKEGDAKYFLKLLDSHLNVIVFDCRQCEFELTDFKPSWAGEISNATPGEQVSAEMTIKVGKVHEIAEYSLLKTAVFGTLEKLKNAVISDKAFERNVLGNETFSLEKYLSVIGEQEYQVSETNYENLARKGHLSRDGAVRQAGENSYKENILREYGNDKKFSKGTVDADDKAPMSLGEKLLNNTVKTAFAEIIGAVTTAANKVFLGNAYGISPATIANRLAADPRAIIGAAVDLINAAYEPQTANVILENIYKNLPENTADVALGNIGLTGPEKEGKDPGNIGLTGPEKEQKNPGKIEFTGDVSSVLSASNIGLTGAEKGEENPGNTGLTGAGPKLAMPKKVPLTGADKEGTAPGNIGLTGTEKVQETPGKIELKGKKKPEQNPGNMGLTGASPGKNPPEKNVYSSGKEKTPGTVPKNIGLQGAVPDKKAPGKIELKGKKKPEQNPGNITFKETKQNLQNPGNIGLQGPEKEQINPGKVQLTGPEPDRKILPVTMPEPVKKQQNPGNVGLTGASPENQNPGNVGLTGASPEQKTPGNVGLTGAEIKNSNFKNIGLKGTLPKEKMPGNIGLTGGDLLQQNPGNIGLTGAEKTPPKIVDNSIYDETNNRPEQSPGKIIFEQKEHKIPAPGQNIGLTGAGKQETLIVSKIERETTETGNSTPGNIGLTGNDRPDTLTEKNVYIEQTLHPEQEQPGNIGLTGSENSIEPKGPVQNSSDKEAKKGNKE